MTREINNFAIGRNELECDGVNLIFTFIEITHSRWSTWRQCPLSSTLTPFALPSQPGLTSTTLTPFALPSQPGLTSTTPYPSYSLPTFNYPYTRSYHNYPYPYLLPLDESPHLLTPCYSDWLCTNEHWPLLYARSTKGHVVLFSKGRWK